MTGDAIPTSIGPVQSRALKGGPFNR